MTRYSWTQPSCLACFTERNPNREPVRVKIDDFENCVYCDAVTTDGIYVRIDPAEAPYPSIVKD
jgi:hypothetical protein